MHKRENFRKVVKNQRYYFKWCYHLLSCRYNNHLMLRLVILFFRDKAVNRSKTQKKRESKDSQFLNGIF